LTRACSILDAGALGTHGLHAWAIELRQDADVRPEDARRHARQQARALLCAQLAPVLGCAAQALAVSDARGQPPRLLWRGPGPAPDALTGIGLSIAHVPGLSLLAWHLGDAVGVDVQALPQGASAAELRRTAALYLSPESVLALDQQAQTAPFFEAFCAQWAAHEARLKCLGLPLAEWHPALTARLAGVCTAALVLPPWAPPACAAALAWRPRKLAP